MRQPADRQQIDPGRGDRRRGFGVMRPEASVIARPSTIATARRSMSGPMLSSSTASTPQRQRLLELRQRVHLQLDLHQMADAGARALDRGAHAAGDARRGCP